MNEQCRFCGAPTSQAFSLLVLGRFDVEYQRCTRCRSLQTEAPYWLDEAYESGAVADLDTGAVLRNLEKQALVVSVLASLGRPRSSAVLDFGGGVGLLCRLLRDCGVDAWLYEPRGSHELCRGFALDEIDRHFDLVCAFEVVEHLVEPHQTLTDLVAAADVVLIGTEPYRDQGVDWWYLMPETGQHVFFWSPDAFAWFARTNGLHHIDLGSHHLLSRGPVSPRRQQALRLLVRSRVQRATRTWLAMTASYEAALRDAGLDV